MFRQFKFLDGLGPDTITLVSKGIARREHVGLLWFESVEGLNISHTPKQSVGTSIT